MKTVFLVSFLLISSLQLFSQNLTFKDTIQTSGTQAELYKKALVSVAKNYKDASKVIQFKDVELGMIVVKAVFKYNQKKWSWGGSEGTKGYVSYTLSITAEDNLIVLEMSDFVHEPTKGTSFGVLTNDEECDIKISLTTKGYRKNIWNDLKDCAKNNSESVFGMFKSL